MELPKVLLAKRPRDPGNPKFRETLRGHLADVMNTAASLLELIGMQALDALSIEKKQYSALSQAVLRGALLHDLGKANSQFQALMNGKKQRQALRHELISVWLPFKFTQLNEWLFKDTDDMIRWAALFAAIGHHLKFENGKSLDPRQGSSVSSVRIYVDHGDFISALKEGGQKLGLATPPQLKSIHINLLDRPLGELRDCLLDTKIWYDKADESTRRFVSLVKTFVIASDVAGSATAKDGIDPSSWAKSVIQRTCTEGELMDIVNSRLSGKNPRKFQIAVSNLNGSGLVRAGCGSGKTLAAYLWTAKYARGKKLFFCYPTTGTATEGFRDYIIPSEMAPDSALLHSRSSVDLENVLGDDDQDIYEGPLRIASLESWDAPLVLCTADLVLGLLQNNRRSLFSFPSFANGAFVFDEIHQYDDRMFGSLLRFLRTFRGAPVLLMTASLPPLRLQAIQDAIENLETINGPEDLEIIPRYSIATIDNSPPWTLIESTIRGNGKVLWVTNTVSRCIKFAREAEGKGLTPLPYHSRYRYCDRIVRHNAVMKAFAEHGPALAVTTQVCEVSLDISADLLITDLAPVPSIIQRMGRLNRRISEVNHGEPKPVYFLRPDNSMPYEQNEIALADKWLQQLGQKTVSQKDLSTAFDKLYQEQGIGPEPESAWLDGGPFSAFAPLREAGMTIPIIREEDMDLCKDNNWQPITKEIERYMIPMSLGQVAKEIGTWKRLGYAFVSPSGRIDYSERWGAKWAKRQRT